MDCPNCKHIIHDGISNETLAGGKCLLTTGICPQCHGEFRRVTDTASGNSYSWSRTREARYSSLIRNGCGEGYKASLYVCMHPEPADAVRLFLNMYGLETVILIPEGLGHLPGLFTSRCRFVVLPEVLFPQRPSLIAESLVLYNVRRPVITAEETLLGGFERLLAKEET